MIKDFLKRELRDLISTKFKKISYSQCGEDMIMAHLFGDLGMDKITYLDVGAHDPFRFSNTAYFYKRGSHGINIEPDPEGFRKFVRERKRDINLNCGIADEDGHLDFYIMNVPTVNTFSKKDADDLTLNHGFKIEKKVKLEVFSVLTILNKYNQGKFPHLLSIDVEGLDEKIIRSLNMQVDKPLVICLETISYSTNGTGKKNNSVIDYLKSVGYMVYADTYVNTIFVLNNVWVRK